MDVIDWIQSLTIGQILKGAALLTGGLSVVFEFSKIKINPLSSVLGWIGGKINGPVMERIEEQEKKLDELQSAVDSNEIDRIRWEILDFANSCRHNKRHSEDEFDHIIELNTKYHEILKRRGMTNGKIDLEYQYVERIYKERQEKNDFL